MRARTLVVLQLVPPALALVAGLALARASVAKAERAVLQAETATAARLLRHAGGGVVVDHLLPGRWRMRPVDDPLLDEAVVEDTPAGLRGRAAVYDAESWFAIGAVDVVAAPAAGRSARTLAAAALAALGVLGTAWLRSKSQVGTAAAVCSWLALVGIVLALATADARAGLARATVRRMELARSALERAPDRDAVLARPGGVFDLTGLPELTSLPLAAAEELARVASPARARVRADGLDYAVADVAGVRLVLLPYEHTLDPGATLAGLALFGALLGALPASLVGLLGRPRQLGRELTAWRFLAPALLHLALFTVGPLVYAAWLSLHRASLIDPGRPMVGLANYAALLHDGGFWNAVRNTALFSLHVPVAMALALGLALLVRRPGRGVLFARAAFFLPSVTSLAAVAVVWQWLLHDEYGLLNAALGLLGLGPVRWLTSPTTALLALMLVAVWISLGYQMVLFQAGLAAIPGDLYDAARIDGASPLRRFLHVTLPGLRHTLFFVLVTSVIGSFQVFGTVYVMTEGGPLHATDVAVFHIYEEAWEYFRFGSASAMSFALFGIIFAVTWLHFRTLERRLEGE
jgi:ABC-type sugar transport system permease subunit